MRNQEDEEDEKEDEYFRAVLAYVLLGMRLVILDQHWVGRHLNPYG